MARRRRGKKRKLTTIRSVKRLISNYIPTKRTTVTTQNSGFVYGTFGKRGFGVIPLNVGGSWTGPLTATELNTFYNIATAAQSTLATPTGSTPHPRMTWRDHWKEYLFHNPTTEGEFVTCWLFRYVGCDTDFTYSAPPWKHTSVPYSLSAWPVGNIDATIGTNPVYGVLHDWYNDYNLTDINAGAGLVGGTFNPFESNFTSYPSSISRFKDRWDIKKKVKFFLTPGQTKRWKLDLGGGSFDQEEHPDHDINATTHGTWYEKISFCLLIMTEGVPTHQNDGTTDNATTRSTINYCATGLEWCSKGGANVGISLRQKQAKVSNNTSDQGIITVAKSLIPEVEGTVRTV